MVTNRRHLTMVAHRNAAHLAVRQEIYRYQQSRIDLIDRVLDQVPWRGGERVLDVGCGNGLYLRRLAGLHDVSVLGVDLSRGMLAELGQNWDRARPRPHSAVCDAQALPVPDASQDAVLAMHMHYHVSDIPLAIRELRRALRPGGRLLVSTNSERDKQEIDQVLASAIATVAGWPPPTTSDVSSRFSLEYGIAFLRESFTNVECREFVGTLVVPTVDPVVRYIASLPSLREHPLPGGVTWESVMAEVERIVTAAIAAEGAFRADTRVGLFICS